MPAVNQDEGVDLQVGNEGPVGLAQGLDADTLEGVDGRSLALGREPVHQVALGEVVDQEQRLLGDREDGGGEALAARRQEREREVREVGLLAGVAQGEVERQAAEDVEAAAGPGDEHPVGALQLVEEREYQHGHLACVANSGGHSPLCHGLASSYTLHSAPRSLFASGLL